MKTLETSVTRRRFVAASAAAGVVASAGLGRAGAGEGGRHGRMKPRDFLYAPDFEPGSALAANEISVRWFGCANYRIEHAGKVLWIDPYLSRHTPREMAFGHVEPKPGEVDAYLDRADYIALGHSHYDHAADLPYIVPKTGAMVYGDKSVGNLFTARDLPRDRFHEISGGSAVQAGPFRIAFIKSVHGKVLGRVPGDRDISPEARPPFKVSDYGCGGVYGIIVEAAGYKIYHQGSGGLVEENLKGARADLAIIGISSRSGTPRMVYKVVKELQPRVVMPTHYDMFFSSLKKGFTAVPLLKFGQVVEEAREAAPEADLITLPLQGEYRIRA